MPDDATNPKAALHDDLRHAILTLERPPGSALDEAALCAAYGLSRTPLREVLRHLAGAGYVTIEAGRGARVSDMAHTTLRDFFLAAPMIYGAVLQLAAGNATPGQIAALKAAQAAFRAALAREDARDRTLANTRFHEITGEMAGNRYLLPSFNRLLIDHARIAMTFYRPRDAGADANLTRAADQHDAMIAAIEAGDARAAARLVDDHWALSRDRIEAFAMPAPLDAALGAAPAR